MSIHIKELRQTGLKQTFGLKKCKTQADQDWRNSKFVFAISSIHAHLHHIKQCVRRLLQCNLHLMQISDKLKITQCTPVHTGSVLDIYYQPNNVQLKDPSAEDIIESRFLK
jgi:hypothetical protein